MKVLFFAFLKDYAGFGEADVDIPAEVTDVASLVTWLRAQDDGYQRAFSREEVVRVAVNQEHVEMDFPVSNGDEVAFFPPMTGG